MDKPILLFNASFASDVFPMGRVCNHPKYPDWSLWCVGHADYDQRTKLATLISGRKVKIYWENKNEEARYIRALQDGIGI